MQIQLKLMGMLKDKTPEGAALDIADDATIADALTALDIPHESVQVFTVNGTLVREQSMSLQDGDELTVFPPVGGG